MTDILVLFLSGFAVGVSVYSIRLLNSLAAMRRQLEEEKAYNEHADAKAITLARQLDSVQALYLQQTRELLAHNYTVIERNVAWKGTKT